MSKLDEMTHESLFTAPHAACQHPELWHSPDSDSTEQEVSELVAALVRATQPELVVETGSAFGYTTVLIGEALRRNGHGYCNSLEPDRDRAAMTRERCLGLPVQVLEMSSLDYSPPAVIGFAFFDSLYELRRLEFERYRNMGVLQPGTIVCFHDWTSGLRGHYMDVRAEVELLHAAGWLRPVYVPTPRGLVIAEVL